MRSEERFQVTHSRIVVVDDNALGANFTILQHESAKTKNLHHWRSCRCKNQKKCFTSRSYLNREPLPLQKLVGKMSTPIFSCLSVDLISVSAIVVFLIIVRYLIENQFNFIIWFWIVGGQVDSRDKLFVTDPERMWQRYRIQAKPFHEVLSINRKMKAIQVRDWQNDKTLEFAYDKLILAPGAGAIVRTCAI